MKKRIPEDANLIPATAERVFEGMLFDVYQWQQEMFDGSSQMYENLRRPDSVAVIGIVDEKILIVKDSQPHKGTHVGFPGGRVDAELDVSTLDAARREMREETGYQFSEWKLIDVLKPESKIEFFVYVYVAFGDYTKSTQQVDVGGEEIAVELLEYSDAVSKLRSRRQIFAETLTLENAGSIEGLLSIPEFTGEEVDIPSK